MSRPLFSALAWVLLIAGFTVGTALVLAFSLPRFSFAMSSIQRVSGSGNFLVEAGDALESAGLPLDLPASRVNPRELERKLSQHRLIKHARAYRRGRTLVLRVTEHTPSFRMVALGGKYWICADDGAVLKMDIDKDHGGLFDEVRKRLTLRLASKSMTDDPRIASQLVYIALRLERDLPRHFSELRRDTRGDYELMTKQGLSLRLGSDEMLNAKLDVVVPLVRYARSRRRPVDYVQFKVEPPKAGNPSRLLAVLKYES